MAKNDDRAVTKVPDKKDDLKDILLSLIGVEYRHIEHYHNQRSTVSNSLVLITAAILGFIAFDKSLDASDLYLTIFLMVIGPFGMAFCWKYFERTALHYAIYEEYRDALDKEVLNSGLLREIKDKVNKAHAENFPWIKKKSLKPYAKISRLWILFHLLIFLLGSFLTYKAYFQPITQRDTPSLITTSPPAS